MHSHRVKVTWERQGKEFSPAGYSRDHQWQFAGGETVQASAAPGYKGNPALVDPEDAFTASLSSCHMLTFLYLAAVKGFTVERYSDDAEGFLGKTDRGMAMTRVVLRPDIEFSGEAPDAAALKQLHHKAHSECFIANSVTTQVDVEPA